MSVLHSSYRVLDTFSLLAAIETMAYDRADLAAEPTAWTNPDETASFLDLHIADAKNEIARRERLRGRSFAPAAAHREVELAELKERVELVAFIQRYTPVQPIFRGKQLVGCCPLPGHQDNTPSFVINPEKQVFFCHGCLRGGDIFSFVLAYFDCRTFPDAVDIVAREAGMPRPVRRKSVPSTLPKERTVRVG